MTDFTQLYHDLQPRLFGYAYHLCQHRQDAEDLVHDAFLSALPVLHTLDPGQLKRCLLRRVKQRWIDRLRRQQLVSYTPLDDSQPSATPDLDTSIAVRQTLALLPAPQRAALIDFYWKGVSSYNQPTFKSRLQRARREFASHWRGAAS